MCILHTKKEAFMVLDMSHKESDNIQNMDMCLVVFSIKSYECPKWILLSLTRLTKNYCRREKFVCIVILLCSSEKADLEPALLCFYLSVRD